MRTDMRDVLKIAAGVFLGLTAFWLISDILVTLTPPSVEERAARDLIERQFAPAH
jgi:hypothetical protein